MMEKMATDFETTAGGSVFHFDIAQQMPTNLFGGRGRQFCSDKADTSSNLASTASENVEAVAAATEELTVSISAISEQVDRSANRPQSWRT